MRAEAGGPPCRPEAAATRSDVLKQIAVAATAGVVTAGAACAGPLPALADNSLAGTKRSYFRYVPRILVLAYFEVVNTAKEDSARPAMYQSSSSRMERELFSPLSVWAQSMSIKGTGPKLRALLAEEATVEKSMAALERAASGKGLKEGESQAKAAKAAWEAGRDALQEYADVANKGMVRQLRKIETPFSKP
eukprot:jgi/Undpi1/10165/HiC_scaffold_28.g12618.m1